MIHWEDILESDDHAAELTKLYEGKSLEQLSEYLGVSLGALRDKMMKEDVPFKTRFCTRKVGKSRLDSLPRDVLETTSPRHIAKLFDMHVSAVYKYLRRRGIRRPSEIRAGEVAEVEEAGMPSKDNVGEHDVEV